MARSDLEAACAEVLRRLIALDGRSMEAVGRDAGFSRSYLSTVLRGAQRLTVDHIDRVLAAIGTPPARYFGCLAAELNRAEQVRGDHMREPRFELDYMESRLRQMAEADRQALERERREDLDSMVRRIVRDELGRRSGD